MNIQKILVLLPLLIVSVSEVSAQIYKCESPNGIVFSDQPCSPKAEVVEVEDTNGGLGVPVSQAEQDVIVNNRANRDRQYSLNRISGQKNRALAEIDRQISALNKQKRQANNNLAGATYSAGIDQQIAALRSARATTETSYQQQINQAVLNER